MSKASGVPLSTYQWSDLASSQKQKVMYAYMSNMRFGKVGSLFLKEGSYTTGKCLYPSLIWQGRDEFDEQNIPRGPFTESESFYMALKDALFAHLKELCTEHHFFHASVPVPQEYDDFQEYRIPTDRWDDYVAIE